MPPENANAPGTQTLSRGFAILECVADGINDVKRLSERLEKPRSTMHRMLSTLVAEGYLHHVPQQGYFLGPKLIRLGAAALQQRPLTGIAMPHLEKLAELSSDTTHLAVLDGEMLLYLVKIPGRRGLEMRSQVGKRMPAASTGVGKGLMLGLPQSDWQGMFNQALAYSEADAHRPMLAPWDEFRATMENYRDLGFSLDFEENELGIRCVGSPIYDISNRAIAGISVASAVPYMSEERMYALGPAVKMTAEAISRDLGWTGGK
ncbi:IclR family transcriptional regulator [Paenirhodobacter populi]|uniref:IclR family transcriptional regulator n=1 Tax=Paenirhodobacter populi TaxID=2306993 RepID=A0A443JA81_9RHOB|nr:IclR family transcriptional regulator [Sinirhodobacter populi]RWR17329.1 IclR family transcriptional regulator [Sinirhodobacter populi]